MLAKPKISLLNYSTFYSSSMRWGWVSFTQHAPRKVRFFLKKTIHTVNCAFKLTEAYSTCIKYMYFTGLKTAGKNFGLWKTAYILYFPDYNPHHRQPAPLFFLSQKETKVNRLPAPPYNPYPHSCMTMCTTTKSNKSNTWKMLAAFKHLFLR